ncbi:Hypothetical protein NocV09_06600050 [Nannochloropsis oceanica]
MRRPRPTPSNLPSFLLLLPVLLLPAAAATADEAPLCGGFPAFMWGGHDSYFAGTEDYALSSVGHDELVESIQSLGSKEAAPEVTVVLVAPPSLHASRPASLPALQAAVQGAPSSRIVPCLTRSSLLPLGDAYVMAQHVEMADVLSFLEKGDLMSNNHMDIIVSSLPHSLPPPALDTLIAELSASLQRLAPDGRYLVVQTTEFSPSHAVGGGRSHHTTHRKLQIDPDDDGFYPKTYLYATPNTVAGLLTAAFMLATVYMAANLLLSMQGPSTFIHGKIPEGKEF